MKNIIRIIIIELATAGFSLANIIYVPSNQPTIQAGIDFAFDGDTVLVMPGVYRENISFHGKKIVVGSQFLTTTDTSFVSRTIIDGNKKGAVVTFNMGEDSSSMLIGLTITNGKGHVDQFRLGAGIYCVNSSPVLEYLKITKNSSEYGGGLYLRNSNLTILNSIVSYNKSLFGGAIYCSDSNPYIINVAIFKNSAFGDSNSNGGAIFGYPCNVYLDRVTITENITGSNGAGIACNKARMVNSIVWENKPVEIMWQAEISYSDVQGGYGGIGNFDFDPKFIRPEQDDFHLDFESPCIDTGDPHSLRDPDSTIADMGAFYVPHESNIPRLLANFSSTLRGGYPPLKIDFVDLSLSYFTQITQWEWDFDNDGITDSYEQNPQWVFTKPGLYSVLLKISNDMLTHSVLKNHYINIKGKGPIVVSLSGSDVNGDGTSEKPFATVQMAIDVTMTADTILVLPGVYNENINYHGKNIVVGSLFLTTRDTSFISKTRIDGNQNGSVVTFKNGENSSATLAGLTITNGKSYYGGGILCQDSSNPTLSNLLITNNNVEYEGGGIYCEKSSPLLSHVKILNNNAMMGGGMACYSESSPYLNRVLFSRNSVRGEGGALCCMDRCKPCLNQVTITQNLAAAPNSGCIYSMDESEVFVINSIFWNNKPSGSDVHLGGKISIFYCDIEKSSKISFGNINTNPLFIDPEMDDFRLQPDSPCIDSGIDFFIWEGDTLVNLSSGDYVGSAPDMGFFESSYINHILDSGYLPLRFALYQNFPNPFNNQTIVRYDLPKKSYVMLQIYNLLGQEIKTLVKRDENPGQKSVIWNGQDNWGHRVSSGVYLCKFQVPGFEEIKRFLYIR